ncbi:MAG: SagB family peptide dehydrogenase [Syntrophomonas sp.]|nr:SagB family peptide dehydrogenase [Syntrophomonas sp.]
MYSNTQNYILSLRQDLQITEGLEETIYFHSSTQSYLFKGFSNGIRKVVEILKTGGGSEEALSEIILQEDGEIGFPRFYYYLQRFMNLGLICHSVLIGPDVLATYIPFSPGHSFQHTKLDMNSRYILSRFAYIRREGRQSVLESPLAHARIVLAHWQASAVINLMADACSCQKLQQHLPRLSEHDLERFLGFLLHAGMIEEVDWDSINPEEHNEVLQQWEFHDLLYHARSRMGRHDQPVGGTYRFRDKISPLPASKLPMSRERSQLYKPDMEKLSEQDYPFTLVLEERKSVREYADQEISAKQLGEFLYRCARIKHLHKANPAAGALYDVSQRPYPGGGACHELEIYLCINKCHDLEPGLYHYAPDHHVLEKLSGLTEDTEALLKDCSYSAGLKDLPPISIHIAARFQRVAWKYQSIAYSLILKNTGVLYQTMYLVATAMDLAPTALGSGNADLLCRAAGLNYLEESAVGEFILGNKRVK